MGAGLSEYPWERELPLVTYIMAGKNVATVIQIPQKTLHESLNQYVNMFRGNQFRIPHPMIPQLHGKLAGYLGIPVSNAPEFRAKIYAGVIEEELPGLAIPNDEGMPHRRATLRRRVVLENSDDDDEDEEYRPRLPGAVLEAMVRRLFGGTEVGNIVFEEEEDLSAPGPAATKPKPEEVTLGDDWEALLREPQKEAPQCLACTECIASVVLIPCRHAAYCDVCFRYMMKEKQLAKRCPLCNADFKTIIRAYN
jgi:hypothetical protein